ncbi:single-stranded-DNA-specific exonuclease RecJ [Belliella kenyensis]|uniref:Single-stranded-DNA-specific exonuclease RecJ n=1 Tax=Belliella kenyensis TaxID=1472724 RepID=A0ABV8EPY4_9BACT|nr:single-stranded-DNA-specific exonuclease RecJ [Belliella kenyensis]MCH7401482.1 single-stranded-DNA-specific exonuclease RecJ [Belliella kenyensis]MDN3603237.1 single-stranded-DNA-specific exonuclease RecJ [Belliella kenyensis]
MEYNWKIRDKAAEENVTSLSRDINVNNTLANMLVNRGVDTFQKAKDYFRPDLDKLHDPFLMKDMDKAIRRLEEAIAREEKILIYGDYDVDGTTSVALVYGYLSQFYKNLEFYIPDRYKEGYGISDRGVRYAAENNFKLIISLDCGIKAIEKVSLANMLGVDFIICDHHTPGDELPAAVAILDPKRKDCEYPYKELSGCGVGFKLMQAFAQHTERDATIVMSYLDLLAISIAADIVPITGENRILAYYGIERLNNNPRPGIKALILKSKIEKEIEISDIVFKIGPRINASGRLEHAKASVELLIAKDLDDALRQAEAVDTVNAARKNFDENITKEALMMIEEKNAVREMRSTVLFKEDWHKGVIGIVASRCIEKFYRPTIILTESNNKATGSARSVYDFDIYEAISECSDLLEQFGGHKYAAGLTMAVDKVVAFQEKFEAVVSSRIQDVHMMPVLEVDDEILLDQINYKFYNILKQMAPFGPGNPEPIFYANQVYAEDVRILKEKHLRFNVVQDGQVTRPVCIAFGMADRTKYEDEIVYKMLKRKMRFDLAFEIRENTFRNNSSLQLYVKDIKFD